MGFFAFIGKAIVGEGGSGLEKSLNKRGKAGKAQWRGDRLKFLGERIEEALEYTRNYEDASKTATQLEHLIPLDKFAKDRVEDALMHAGFTVPHPSPEQKANWQGVPFDVVGLSNDRLVVGDVNWSEEVKIGEVISFLNKVRQVKDSCNGKELTILFASSKKVSGLAKETFNSFPAKKLLVCLNGDRE